MNWLHELTSLSPLALFALTLLVFAATAYRLVPTMARRLTTKVEHERTDKISESVEARVSQRLFDSLSTEFFEQNRKRGDRLHSAETDITRLNLLTERHDRDIEELKEEQRLTQEHAASMDRAIVQIRADQRYSTQMLEDMRRRLASLEGPIRRIDMYFELRQRQGRGPGPSADTPEPTPIPPRISTSIDAVEFEVRPARTPAKDDDSDSEPT